MAMTIVVTLAGCGGGGGSTSQSPTTPGPYTTKVGIGIAGDSTVYGYTVTNGAGQQANPTAPQELQNELQARFGTGVTVDNWGIPGADSEVYIDPSKERVGPVHPTVDWLTMMATTTDQIIVIQFGINDAAFGIISPDQFKANLITMVQEAMADGKIVILETANPIAVPAGQNLPTYVEVTRTVAQELNLPLIDQYAAWTAMPNWQSYLSDGVHPTETGYIMKGLLEYSIIEPIIMKIAHQ